MEMLPNNLKIFLRKYIAQVKKKKILDYTQKKKTKQISDLTKNCNCLSNKEEEITLLTF